MNWPAKPRSEMCCRKTRFRNPGPQTTLKNKQTRASRTRPTRQRWEVGASVARGCRWRAAARQAAMGRKTPEPVKQPKPKKTPDDKRLISFRIAHAVADPDARPPPRSPQAASPKTRRSPSASPARLPISASSESKAARRGAVPPSPPPLPPVRFAASHDAFSVAETTPSVARARQATRRWRRGGR